MTNQVYQQPVYFYHTFACDKFRVTPQRHDITYNGHTLKPDSYDFWLQNEHHGGTDGTWNTSAQFENNTMENWLADPAVGYEVKLKYYGDVDKSTNTEVDYYSYQVGDRKKMDDWGFGFEDPVGTYTFPADVSIGFFLMIEYPNNYEEFMVLSEPDRGDFLSVFTQNWSHADSKMLTWYNDHGNFTHYKPMYCARIDADNSNGNYWPSDVSPTGVEDGKTLKRMVYTWEDAVGGPGDTNLQNRGDDDKLDFNDYMFMLTLGETQDRDTNDNGHALRYGTYIFEDLFPSTGDYDMNDVIISYTYDLFYDEDDNIIDFSYSFKPLWDGATYQNDFWVAYSDETGDQVVQRIYEDNSKWVEGVGGTSHYFTGHAFMVGDNLVSSRNYGTDKENDDFAKYFIGKKYTEDLFQKVSPGEIDTHYGLNPFIYVATTSQQVHLSKYTWVDLSDFGIYSERPTSLYGQHYLVQPTDNKYVQGVYMPFAMDIAWWRYYEEVPETQNIVNFYTNFLNWYNDPENPNYTGWFKDHFKLWGRVYD